MFSLFWVSLCVSVFIFDCPCFGIDAIPHIEELAHYRGWGGAVPCVRPSLGAVGGGWDTILIIPWTPEVFFKRTPTSVKRNPIKVIKTIEILVLGCPGQGFLLNAFVKYNINHCLRQPRTRISLETSKFE